MTAEQMKLRSFLAEDFIIKDTLMAKNICVPS